VADASKSRSQKDKEMAARLKRLGIERTSGRCAACYRLVRTDSWKSRYTHICPGGVIRHR
jgi:formamidopyrimidine-DNA glycosylase